MSKGPSTQAIHGRKDPTYRSGVYPVYQTTTFAVEKSDEYDRYIQGDPSLYVYSRSGNPSIHNVEEKLAALEHAEAALLFSSGMAAVSAAILSFVGSGDTIVASESLYGTTARFLTHEAPRYGIQVYFLQEKHLYELDQHIDSADLVYFETPINPHAYCIDIKRVADAATRADAISVIDNTFASPINQNPLDLGVDVVLHSATKYIGGHSDVMAGAVMASHNYIDRMFQHRVLHGAILNPQEAFLLDRSLKTLPLRIEKHNSNAMTLARFLSEHPKVDRVYYPGLPGSPGYEIAKEQMRGYGGMMCIDLGTLEAAKKFCDSLEIALNATSLGSVETLVSIPVLTSHIKLSEGALEAAGVTPGMVRISVGLEDINDLLEDFVQALG